MPIFRLRNWKQHETRGRDMLNRPKKSFLHRPDEHQDLSLASIAML